MYEWVRPFVNKLLHRTACPKLRHWLLQEKSKKISTAPSTPLESHSKGRPGSLSSPESNRGTQNFENTRTSNKKIPANMVHRKADTNWWRCRSTMRSSRQTRLCCLPLEGGNYLIGLKQLGRVRRCPNAQLCGVKKLDSHWPSHMNCRSQQVY